MIVRKLYINCSSQTLPKNVEFGYNYFIIGLIETELTTVYVNLLNEPVRNN